MKRVALGSGLMLMLVVACLLYLNSNLDRLVQKTIETQARQIADPLLRQLSSQVASSLLELSAANLKDSAAELGRFALDKAADAGESLKEGLDNLLQRN